jgi:hypothetical protein
MAKKKLTIPLFHANEDGTTCEIQADLALNDELKFVKRVPQYMTMGGNSFLVADSAMSLKSQYEALADVYSRRKALGEGTPMIVFTPAAIENGIAVDITEVTQANGLLFSKQLGHELPPLSPGQALLQDTPATRAKLDEIRASIKAAGDLLAGIETAADPTGYLLMLDLKGGKAPVQIPLEGGDVLTMGPDSKVEPEQAVLFVDKEAADAAFSKTKPAAVDISDL